MWDEMTATIDSALTDDYLLGNEFSMADVIFGGTLRFMTMFKMLDASPAISKYLERVADHATNIAEEVFYLNRGQDIRHDPALKQPAPGGEGR